MGRGRVNRKLEDAERIRLFAEYHIEKVRFAKGGISAVKHTAYGWISPQQYYALQKLHDILPLVQEFIRGGYQAKAWLWSVSVDVLGVTIPVGTALPVVETWNLFQELTRTKEETYTVHVPPGYYYDRTTHKLVGPGDAHMRQYAGNFDVTDTRTVPDIHPDMLALRAYALLGPFGDVIQIMDAILAGAKTTEEQAKTWVAWLSEIARFFNPGQAP